MFTGKVKPTYKNFVYKSSSNTHKQLVIYPNSIYDILESLASLSHLFKFLPFIKEQKKFSYKNIKEKVLIQKTVKSSDSLTPFSNKHV